MDKETIIQYYEYTLPFYRFFWHQDSHAIHYGFWENGTKNHHEALLNTNKFLAEKAKIKSRDIVLDAGCGIGGSAIWLAKNLNVNVVGITLSKKQVDEAKKLALQNNAEELTEFYQRDFTNSYFENEHFDVVWAIESICHNKDKKDFIKEAYRILKKDGRIIVDDGFLLREPENSEEEKSLYYFLDGLALPNLSLESEFKKSLEEIGFRNIKVWDKTEEAFPSAKNFYKLSVFSYPFSWFFEKLGITSEILTKNSLAGFAQYKMIKNGLMGHRVFYGEK